jgi:biopolymer transport protein ExbB/TolQ
MFLVIIEIAVAALIVWAVLTQVLVPLSKGRRVFPLFSREARLRLELNELERKMREQELERTIERKLDEQYREISRPFEKEKT